MLDANCTNPNHFTDNGTSNSVLLVLSLSKDGDMEFENIYIFQLGHVPNSMFVL